MDLIAEKLVAFLATLTASEAEEFQEACKQACAAANGPLMPFAAVADAPLHHLLAEPKQ